MPPSWQAAPQPRHGERRESRSNGQVSFHRGEGARVIHWPGPVEGKGPSESLIEIAKRLFSVFTPLLSPQTKPAAAASGTAFAAKETRSATMNIFRFFGDMSHLASILVLLLKLRASKSAAGIIVKDFLGCAAGGVFFAQGRGRTELER